MVGMNKPFTTMKDNVATLVQQTDSNSLTRIGVWLNNAYRDFINSFDWDELFFTQSITSTASVSAYPLNYDTDQILSVLDVTNDEKLSQITEKQFQEEYGDVWDSTGTPTNYFLRYLSIKDQPSAATSPTVASNSSNDSSQTVQIRGISGGSEVSETLTINGTTDVTAAFSYTEILGFSKSTTASGTFTLYDNDESTELARLVPEELTSRYKQIHLHYIPSGTIVYRVRGKRRPAPLNNDYDYPVIECCDAIEKKAIAEAWRYKRQFTKAREYDMQYEQLKMDMIQRRTNQPDMVVLLRPTPLDRDEGIIE